MERMSKHVDKGRAGDGLYPTATRAWRRPFKGPQPDVRRQCRSWGPTPGRHLDLLLGGSSARCRFRNRLSTVPHFFPSPPFFCLFCDRMPDLSRGGVPRCPRCFPPILPPLLDAQRLRVGGGLIMAVVRDFARLGSRIHEFAFAPKAFP